MANNYFQKRLMASECVNAFNRSVQYQVAATPATATQGMLVKIGDRVSTVWGTKDKTTYSATAPTADTDPIYVLDIAESPFVTNSALSTTYRVGHELSNIQAPAETPVRARKPKLDDTYEIGADNFATAPTVGQYAVPTAGDTTYTPAASQSSTKHCVYIEESITVGFGVSKSITAYVVRVVTEK